MEYAMATLINGDKKYGSVLGTTAHEMAHSWFHMVLATNESKHPWMDEGFTSYIAMKAMNEFEKEPKDHFLEGYYNSYIQHANSGQEQPATTHSDRYATNRSYSINAYVKGAIFVEQLGYLIGEENLSKSLKRYYKDWGFKHPTPNDFIRIAEKVSGAELQGERTDLNGTPNNINHGIEQDKEEGNLEKRLKRYYKDWGFKHPTANGFIRIDEKVSGAELQWYLTDWIGTTNTIDYGIDNVKADGNKTIVTLKRNGLMPMPLEVRVDYKDGSSEDYYIPLRMMFWEKPNAGKVQKDWAWAYPTYDLILDKPESEVKRIEIDPSKRMADVQRFNNVYQQ